MSISRRSPGSGRGGLITLDDVLAAERLNPRDRWLAAARAAPATDGAAEPLRGVRRAMAHSMSLSRDQVSGSTVCDDADIHGWIARGRLHAAADARDDLRLARGARVERLVRLRPIIPALLVRTSILRSPSTRPAG